jgi:hypothetical protein
MRDDDSLTSVFARIAEELHHQYLLGFVPSSQDGRVANIDVRVTRRGLDVRARRHFSVAPPPPPAPQEARPVTEPLAPLSDAEVEAALTAGLDERPLRATCRASVPGQGAFFEVAAEGPTGRVMRAAREARQRGEALAPSEVAGYLRRAMVSIVATGHVSPAPALPGDADLGPARPPVALPFAQTVQVRSLGDRPVLLQPAIDQVTRLRPGLRETLFDLAAFRALGDPVEVLVATGSATARCRLSGRELANIR